jgi:hypothetical protein
MKKKSRNSVNNISLKNKKDAKSEKKEIPSQKQKTMNSDEDSSEK